VSKDVNIPESATEITVALQIYGPGTVWFDDVNAIPIGDAPPATTVKSAAETTQTVVADAPAVEVASLVSNPGIEKGEGGSPAGWRQGADIPGVEYIWDRNTGHKSKSSLCLRKTANRYFPIAQWFQQIQHDGSGRRLRVAAWVKTRQAYKAVMDVQFSRDGDSWSHEWVTYIGAKNAGDPPANHDWQQYLGTVRIPAGTRQILIAPQIYGPGTVWFDDIVVEVVD
jgi:hypothetical protein